MGDKKKNKPTKFKVICFKHFELAVMLRRMCVSLEDMKNVPYYKTEIDNKGRVTLNLAKEKGTLNINKVRYVKLTVPKNIVERIDLNKYDKVKIVKPEQNFYKGDDRCGVMIPLSIFEMMLINYNNHTSGTLSSLLSVTMTPDSIKLLDKEKKFIAYMLPKIDF